MKVMPRTCRIAALLFCVGLLSLAAYGAGGDTVSLDDYRAMVRDYNRVVSTPRPNLAHAATLEGRLGSVKKVQLSNGETIAVDTAPLARDLHILVMGMPAATPPPTGKSPSPAPKTRKSKPTTRKTHPPTTDKAKTAERAQTLAEIVAPPAPPLPLSGNPQADAKAILARGEFRSDDAKAAKDTAFDKWWARQWQAAAKAIIKFLTWLFSGLPKTSGNGPDLSALAVVAVAVRWLLIGVAAAVALWGLFLLGRSLLRRQKRKATGGAGGDLDLADEEMIDPLGSARTLAAQGDYRMATRLVYIASLKRLGEAGLLTLEKNRTNWEYQRSLRSRSAEAYSTLLPGTRLFDRTWYGRQQATRAEWESMVAVHDALPALPPPVAADGGTTPASGATP